MNLEFKFLGKDIVSEIFGRGYDHGKVQTALHVPSELCAECGYAACDCPCEFVDDTPPYSTLPKLLSQDPTVTAIMGVVADMRKDVNEAGSAYALLAPYVGSYIVQLEMIASNIKLKP